jgi:O-antigen/teichoic acid export membrane protein
MARAATWVGAGHVFSLIARYGSLIFLAALLPPKAFGTLATGLAVIYVANLLVAPGIHASLVATRELTTDQLQAALVGTLVRGAALAAGMALLARLIVEAFASGGDAGALQALSLSIFFTAAAVVPLGLLQRRMDFYRRSAIMTAAAVAAAVVSVCAGIFGAGVWALVVRQALADLLVACFAWYAVRNVLPSWRPRRSIRRLLAHRSPAATTFFLFTLAQFVGLSVDKLIVGNLTDAGRLGLYSLAYTLGFVPLTQFTWQLGQVLFAATAATPDVATIGSRTVKAVRLAALGLLPLVPPALALAPVLIPAVLGEEWREMVVPFQILLLAGVIHALVGVLGESLSGSGNIGFRARVDGLWAVSTATAVFVLVHFDGIRGAAIAHVALAILLAAAYVVFGARRVAVEPARLWVALRPIAVTVVSQALATVALAALLERAGVGGDVAAAAAAFAGLLLVLIVLARLEPSPLRDGKAVVAAALARGTA